MSEIIITSQNFNEVVNKSDKPVLIDLWASWCGPCQMLAPVISQIAEEHPEIKGLEYDGEIRTAEELDEIWNESLDQLLAEYGEEAVTEAVTEAMTE